jgi:hypothetical protein
VVLDEVSFGTEAPSLAASSQEDESLGRFPDGRDTGSGSDFLPKRATPGRSNGTGSPAARGEAVINEVVLSPFEDYNADGNVSSADQFIELLNKSGRTLDLTGWSMRMVDASPLQHPLTRFRRVVFGSGGTLESFAHGEHVALLHPLGTMSSSVLIQLFDLNGTLVDEVQIGGNTASTDYAGDGPGNGAPESGEDGKSFGIGDSAIARVPDGQDTRNDPADFIRQEPTLAATNNIVRNDGVPPSVELAGTTTGAGFPVSGTPKVRFTEPVATSAVSEALVTLHEKVLLDFGDDAPPAQRLVLADGDNSVVIIPRGALKYSTAYTIVLSPEITDRAGNELSGTTSFTFTTEAPPANPAAVRINEAVVDPQRNWKVTGFTNPDPPLDPNLTLSTHNEWVELYNASATAVDLTAWSLTMIDSSRDTMQLGAPLPGHAVVCFSGAGIVLGENADCLANVPAGGYVVIGDPTGSMSNDVYLELRDAAGAVVDSVEIGGRTESTDYGGDGPGNGAPGGGNGAALGVYDESVARVPNGKDTGDDLTDWAKQRATLGRSNDLSFEPDTTLPAVASLAPTLAEVGGRFRVDTDFLVTFTKPMTLATITSGTVFLDRGSSAVPISVGYRSLSDRQVRVSFNGRLEFDSTYTLTVRGTQAGVRDQSRNPDPRGNPMLQDFVLTFQTEPAPAPSTGVVINEVVSDPQRDWNDSILGPGAPFDALVGLNIGTAADEWLELYNNGSAMDLTGWIVTMKDSDYSEHRIGSPAGSTVERYSGSGGAGVIASRAYLVVGDPPGSMLDNVFVGLRRPDGVLVDAVRVQGGAGSPEDEAFARFPNGKDTNVEIIDFTKTRATILGPNNPGSPAPQGAALRDVVLTELVVAPKSDWNDSTDRPGSFGDPFDGVPGLPTKLDGKTSVTTSDEYVELANVSGKVLKIKGWTLSMVDSSPAVYTLGSSPAIEHYRCNAPCVRPANADSFPPHAILVLGNPPGSMNNSVFLILEDVLGQEIDKVMVGGRTASTNFEADDDRDGRIDEDPIDGEDNDGDGLVDEDPPDLNVRPGIGIPRGGDGASKSTADEAFHRIKTTGVYQDDWRRGSGTPGTANLAPLLKPVDPSPVPLWPLSALVLPLLFVRRLRRGTARRARQLNPSPG